ncbi:MAG: DNA polymerase Y family protein [Steroidobacteraceae bacterium]
MLWLCIRLPQLAREARGAQPQAAPAQLPAEDLPAQRVALERLAAWAYQWSSLVSYDSEQPLLWLELGASCALFEGLSALLSRIKAELAQLGYSHACAVAPSPTAAALLTRAPGCCHALTPAQLRALLEPMPLTLLDLPAAVLSGFTGSGLRRIGEVLALPAAAIARRFEPATLLYLQRLLAEASDPRPAWRLPLTYRARCEFAIEVRDSTALLFPLQRLLLEFQGYLRARDRSVQRFLLQFEHYRHPASRVSIGLSAPGRDAAQFLTLVRERMHSLALPAAVSALRLEALEFTSPTVLQTDLFGDHAQPLQQLQRLLDRLRARLGEDSVRALTLAADYRPERGWRFVTPEHALQQNRAQEIITSPDASPRPCWLLSAPVRVDTPDADTLLHGPERIESGWWDGSDSNRDYYFARTRQGSRLWLFHDRRADHWYLQGLWA